MTNGEDVSNNQPLTGAQQSALIVRMKAAWASLPADLKEAKAEYAKLQ
jgi:hypothetical protein